ncbi:MAG: hypothetical protein FJ406_00295 [Verrucomicrobia bacterium]|nr:hypothetical protein [Verrucomicrobiota bacterium]
MKLLARLLILSCLAAFAVTAPAQLPGRGLEGAPGIGSSGAMLRFLGEHKAFIADVNIGTKGERGEAVLLPGKLAFSDGQSRLELDLAKVEAGRLPPIVMESLKAAGMGQLVILTRPDRKLTYYVYPGMQAYSEMPLSEEQSGEAAKALKLEIMRIGEENLGGHPCVKNRVVVTDAQGKTQEATTWNATDLRNFPVAIETKERGTQVTLFFSNVRFGAPPNTAFEVPRDLRKYADSREMMREAMMKLLGGGAPK